MTKLEFMQNLADAFKVDASFLKEDMALPEMEGWDSMALVSVITLLTDIGVNVKVAQLREAKTVADIVALAGDQLKD